MPSPFEQGTPDPSPSRDSRPPIERSSDRPFTYSELIKMRRRLIEDCEIYEARARHLQKDSLQRYDAAMNACHSKIDAWIQKQFKHSHRYQAILIGFPASKKSPRGEVTFILDDGSSFSILETDPYHGHRYYKELIGDVYRHHFFLEKEEGHSFTASLTRRHGIARTLETTWRAGSIDRPGSVPVQYNPTSLHATAHIEHGEVRFKTTEKPQLNPFFDDPAFEIKNVIRVGRSIEQVMPSTRSVSSRYAKT